MKTDPTIIASDDIDRLAQLVRTLRQSPSTDQQQLDLLDEALQNAESVSSERVPMDVIRMNSRFRVLDVDSGKRLRYTLVFPQSANISEGRISILAPVGTAVLGRRRGDVVEAKVPGGSRRLRIERVWHRPVSTTRSILTGNRVRPSGESDVSLQSTRAA